MHMCLLGGSHFRQEKPETNNKKKTPSTALNSNVELRPGSLLPWVGHGRPSGWAAPCPLTQQLQAATRSGTSPSARSLLQRAGELLLPPAPAVSSAAEKPLGFRHALPSGLSYRYVPAALSPPGYCSSSSSLCPRAQD